jgi:hypothetical protein
MNKNILLGCILILFAACGNTTAPQNAPKKYFDLKGYFEQEAMRLNKTKPLVYKTVKVNEATENKKIRIADWNKELANFIDADINKNAWQGSFKIERTADQDLFTSNDEKIVVKKLKITYKNDKITTIEILLNTSNYLYHSTDTLTYQPEKGYEIKKTQQIKLLNPKRYEIKGTF